MKNEAIISKEVFVTDGIKMKAKNSSGKQRLFFNFQDDDHTSKSVSATLWGNYNGDDIQIDFDCLTTKKLKKMRKVINKMIKLKTKH